ncbi:MAG TPA: hypothetical protein VK576_03760 [Thermoleophilia bacterium]|nr:hypothetical protein [Thermoleophilia bacterium]
MSWIVIETGVEMGTVRGSRLLAALVVAALAAALGAVSLATPPPAAADPATLWVDALNDVHLYGYGTATFAFRITDLTGDGPYPVEIELNCGPPTGLRTLPVGMCPANQLITFSWPCDLPRGGGMWWVKLADDTLCYGFTDRPWAILRNDDLAPTTVPQVPVWWVTRPGGVALGVTAVDDASGVSATEQSFDGGLTWQPWGNLSFSVPDDHSADGVRTVAWCRSTDGDGNVEAPVPVVVRIDTVPPATGDNAGTNWHAAPFSLALTPSDATSGMSSGLARTEFSTDAGATWTVGTGLEFVGWRRGGGSGVYPVLVRSTDAAGNVETPRRVDVKMDTEAPSTTDDAPSLPSASPVTVTFTGHDRWSGIASTWYQVDGGEWTEGGSVLVPAPSNHTNDGLHTICYYSVDNAGNRQIGYRVCVVTIATPAGASPVAHSRHRVRPHVGHRMRLSAR